MITRAQFCTDISRWIASIAKRPLHDMQPDELNTFRDQVCDYVSVIDAMDAAERNRETLLRRAKQLRTRE